jgi:hypothetical protein
MPINFKKPKLQKIQEFSSPSNYDEWIPGLFSDSYFGNLFPINSDGDYLDQNFAFVNNNVDNFQLSMNRYMLFLYCLKTNPYLFTQASNVIGYDRDEFLLTAELAEYLQAIQTNTIKNSINSSLTIELVKKYALDNLLDLNPKNLASFLDVAKTQDFIDKVASKLNVVLYESVVKHSLYNKLKENSTFLFKEDSSTGWAERAANLSYGETEYFIDVEGGPDNKSFPVVCVITKVFSKDSKDNVIQNSNKFLSDVFGRKVDNKCLARIVGNPNQFENNFKQIPILKSKKDNENYYSSVCVVYDFSRILLSPNAKREFNTHFLIESSLGFLSKNRIELNNIRDLELLKEKFSSSINKYFNDDSFENYSFQVVFLDKHSQEINSRINLEKVDEIKSNIRLPITINKQNLLESFNLYIDNIITQYEFRREQNIYLSAYSQKDIKVFLHFDSFYNLLAITSIPSKKEIVSTGEYFTPFLFAKNNNNSISFDLIQTDANQSKTDKFYTEYLEFPPNTVPDYSQKELVDLTGHKLCYTTRILEKQIADNFNDNKPRISADKKDQSKVLFLQNLNLKGKLKIEFEKKDLFEEDRFIDKNIEFIVLSTTYRENKYQSSAFQTLNYYLYTTPTIDNSLKKINNKVEDDDLGKFASLHYPVLSLVKREELNNTLPEIVGNLADFELPQEILIVSSEVQKAFSLFKGVASPKDSLNVNLQHYAISSLPCYADLLLLIPEISKTKNTKDLILLIFQIVDKLPILDILSTLSLENIDKLIRAGETAQQACYPLPAKINLSPDDLLRDLEYLKTLYYNIASTALNIEGIITEIPKLPVIDIFGLIMKKISFFILNIAANWLLSFLSKKLRKYLEKFCTIDFNLLDLLQDKNQVVDLGFRPRLIADPFGAVAGSGGGLDTVEVSLDINTLIDLSKRATREFVYSKFADKYFLSKTQERFDEISTFFYDISNVVDAFELAALLRGVQTEQTTSNLLDFIRISDFTFKNLFVDSASISDLFIFLAEYCDYRLCYDFLANSLESYAGNICSPQNSKKDKIDGELNSLTGLGQDVQTIIRDQIFDLQKELDEICAIDTNLNIDIFKDGPKLLASSFNKIMSLPLSTVVQFQENVLDYELGRDETGSDLSAEQKKLLGNRIFDETILEAKTFGTFKKDFENVSSKYYNSINITQLFRFWEIGDGLLGLNELENETENDENNKKIWNGIDISVKDAIILAIFQRDVIKKGPIPKEIEKAKEGLINSIKLLGLEYDIKQLENIIYRDYVSYPLLISETFYNKIIDDGYKFGKKYKDFIYNVDYLSSLVSDIEEEMKNATNIDLQDDETLLFSYIDKIKELQ